MNLENEARLAKNFEELKDVIIKIAIKLDGESE